MALKSKTQTPIAANSAAPVVNLGSLELTAVNAVLAIPTDIIDVQSQVRTIFEEEKINQLAEDIEQLGQLQAGVVRPHPDTLGRYVLVAGERRYRACVKLGRDFHAIVDTEYRDPLQILNAQWSENEMRVALSIVEKKSIYESDLARLGTQAAVAKLRRVSEAEISAALNVGRDAMTEGTVVNQALKAGISDTSDLRTVQKIGELNKPMAEALIAKQAAAKAKAEQSNDKGKSTEPRTKFREEIREVHKAVSKPANAGKSGAKPTYSATELFVQLHAFMGVDSTGQEFAALDEMDDYAKVAMMNYLKPIIAQASQCSTLDATRTLHKTVFAVSQDNAVRRFMVAAFMCGLLTDTTTHITLKDVLKQASYSGVFE